jgi:hypothetical protein
VPGSASSRLLWILCADAISAVPRLLGQHAHGQREPFGEMRHLVRRELTAAMTRDSDNEATSDEPQDFGFVSNPHSL